MKYWVKLYSEGVHDPKLGRLPWDDRGVWLYMLMTAGEIDGQTPDGEPTGATDTVEGLAWRFRLTEERMREVLERFIQFGMCHVEGEIIYLTNFPKRQTRPPTGRRDAWRQRKRELREREKTTLPPPADDRLEEMSTLLETYGVMVQNSAQASAWARIQTEAGEPLFKSALQEAAQNTKDGTVSIGYVRRIVSDCQAENRMPGEWSGNDKAKRTAEAESVEAPTEWHNPLTGEMEQI